MGQKHTRVSKLLSESQKAAIEFCGIHAEDAGAER